MLCVTILLTVNDPADVEEVRGLLAEQGRLSRGESGCLRYEVYHSRSDPQTFILSERWENQAALDLHRTAKAYTEIYQPRVLPKANRVPHPADLVE